MPRLPSGDQGFASSLIVQYDAKGELTEKQWYWIERLAADVGAGDVPDFTQPAKEIVHVGEFGGVIALFEKAKEYLKYPKITLALPDGSPLQLNLAGKGSKFPGTVGLTDGAAIRRQQMVRPGDEGRRVGARQALRPAEDRPFVDPRPASQPSGGGRSSAWQAHRPLLLLQLGALRREVDGGRLWPGLRQALGPAARKGVSCNQLPKKFDPYGLPVRVKVVEKSFVPRRAP